MKNVFRLLLILLCFQINAQCLVSNGVHLRTLRESSGSREIDRYILANQMALFLTFNVSPDLKFYEDGHLPNVVAAPPNIIKPKATVAIGLTMLRQRLWNRSELTFLGVLAHEYAHVAQFGRDDSLTNKQMELHADFLAGHHFALQKLPEPEVRVFVKDFFMLGDSNFWDPEYHGKPVERVEAFMAGYNLEKTGPKQSYQDGLDWILSR